MSQPTQPITVRIMPNDKGSPTGKLADAEIHFHTGPLSGLKLLGFAIWERRTRDGRNVTFPARTYVVNGERRSFSLLRDATGSGTGSDTAIKALILQALDDFDSAANTDKGPQTPEERHQADKQTKAASAKAAKAPRDGKQAAANDDGFKWAADTAL